MVDKNSQIRKKFIIFLVAILVLTPFVFMLLKYNPIMSEEKNRALKLENELAEAKKEIGTLQTQLYDLKRKDRTQSAEKLISKDEFVDITNEIESIKQSLQNLKEEPKKDGGLFRKIYNKELYKNSVQVHFHPGEFTQIDDILYVSGNNEKGFAVIDISDPDEIKPLGFFNYKHKGRIAQLDLAPSKNGDFVIMADPESGIYKIDTRDFANMKIVSFIPIYTAHRVILSNDNKTAFVMSYNGITSLNVEENIVKLDEFEAKVDLSGLIYVDKEHFHFNLSDNIANGDLKFINDDEILFMTYGGAYIFDVSNPTQIKCVKQNLENKSSPWKMQISKDGKKAYYAELKKFVVFDIDKFEIEKTFANKYYFMYQEFGILENLELFYFYISHYNVDDKYESEAVELIDINDNILKTYIFPQVYASHIGLSNDKQNFFVGFLGGRRYYVSLVNIKNDKR